MTEADPLKDAEPVVSSLPGEAPEHPPTETEPIPESAQAPPEPQGPTLQEVLTAILKHQEEMDKRLESMQFNYEADHGTLLKHDEILRKVDNALDKMLAGMQQAQGAGVNSTAPQGPSLGGFTIQDLLGVAKQMGLSGTGGDPMDAIYQSIGRKVFDGTVDSTVRKITKQLGGETASHVVVDSGHG